MKNKYDDIQEAVLKSAFEEAFDQDVAELEAMDIEILYPTEEQRREVERALRKAKRKNAPKFGRVWRAVAMIAIVCCLGCGLLLSQPNIRASVWDAVVSFFEKYFTFGANSDAASVGYALGKYTIGYVPEGYLMTDKRETSYKTSVVLKKAENAIYISVYSGSINQKSGDNETNIVKSILIGETTGYLIQYHDSDVQKLIWGNEEHSFAIQGSISEKEFLKIAENIQ